jgi:hypothetical protein
MALMIGAIRGSRVCLPGLAGLALLLDQELLALWEDSFFTVKGGPEYRNLGEGHYCGRCLGTYVAVSGSDKDKADSKGHSKSEDHPCMTGEPEGEQTLSLPSVPWRGHKPGC